MLLVDDNVEFDWLHMLDPAEETADTMGFDEKHPVPVLLPLIIDELEEIVKHFGSMVVELRPLTLLVAVLSEMAG